MINKILDLPDAMPVEVAEEIEQVLGFPAEDAILVSAKTGQEIDELIGKLCIDKPATAQGQSRCAGCGADFRQHLRRLPRRHRRPRRGWLARHAQGQEDPVHEAMPRRSPISAS